MPQKTPIGPVSSPLDRDLITTFTAARILFPNQPITSANLRFVQRLCQRNELDCWKIAGKYLIDRESLDHYIEEVRHRSKWGVLD